MNRKLLLISDKFPPDNAAAAVRPGQLFRYLPACGFQPVVIASSDEKAPSQPPFVIRTPLTEQTATVNLAARLARAFTRYCAPYNDHLPWVPAAVSAARHVLRSGDIAAIYSTSPFLSAHVAALWLKTESGLPWIADFQDPIRDNPFRTRKWFYPYDSILERSIFQSADFLLANTDTVAALWTRRYPRLASKFSILWNSFDPDEVTQRPAPSDRSFRVLAHVGALYGGRHPGLLIQSLERLKIKPSELRVKLTGPIEGEVLASLGPLFERARASGLLEFENQLVPREKAMSDTADADYLLLLDMNERNVGLQMPSKVLDYVRFGKPVLAFTPAGSPTQRVLEKSGICFVAIDPRAPEETIDDKVRAFLGSPTAPRAPTPWFEQTFSAVTQAEKVGALIAELLKRKASAQKGDAGASMSFKRA